MNKLAGKIKNIFGRRRGPEMTESKKDGLFNEAMWGANDISRSIRESNKLQMQKSLFAQDFSFLNYA